jgi:hypothetical protein
MNLVNISKHIGQNQDKAHSNFQLLYTALIVGYYEVRVLLLNAILKCCAAATIYAFKQHFS